MRRRLLAALLGAAALATPAPAQAELVVSGPSAALGGTGTTAIAVEADAPAARLLVLAPRGFTAVLGHTPGAIVGEGSGRFLAGGAGVQAGGSLVAGETGEPACGASGHEAVWRLALGEGLGDLALAVDAVALEGAEGAHASYRIEACPGEGTLVGSLELRLEDVFAAPSSPGTYAWRAVVTPADGSGAPRPGASVESRSTQALPVRITLKGAFDRRGGDAVLSGLVTAAGSTLAGVRVAFAAGRPGSSLAPAGSATTGSQGRYRKRRSLRRTTVFEAQARIPAQPDPDGCPAPIAPGGCVSATLAPASVVSRRVTVRVPILRTLRLGSRGVDVRHLRAELVRLRYLPPGAQGARFDERTWHAVVALQGWVGLGRTGVVDRRTWRALARGRTPIPWAQLRRGVLIDTARQVMLLVEGGRTVRAIHVSTGAYGRTPKGRYAVYRKEILSWSVPFSTWMPYASYFSGGFAMHSYPSVPAYPASHGCVRIPPVEAPGVYRFAGYGTPVWIR